MPDVSKYQSGDMFFDRGTGFVYVVANFQPATLAARGFSNESNTFYRVYRYGKPPKGKFIQHFSHEQLARLIKTSSPEAARILFGEVKQWLNTK
jgi:hypothetical protein